VPWRRRGGAQPLVTVHPPSVASVATHRRTEIGDSSQLQQMFHHQIPRGHSVPRQEQLQNFVGYEAGRGRGEFFCKLGRYACRLTAHSYVRTCIYDLPRKLCHHFALACGVSTLLPNQQCLLIRDPFDGPCTPLQSCAPVFALFVSFPQPPS
jgi:hypothetical protein